MTTELPKGYWMIYARCGTGCMKGVGFAHVPIIPPWLKPAVYEIRWISLEPTWRHWFGDPKSLLRPLDKSV